MPHIHESHYIKPEEVMNCLLDGCFDESLDAFAEMIRQRRDQVANRLARTIEVGTMVRVKKGIKPAYFVGKIGRVTRQPSHVTKRPKAGFVWVDFGEQVSARFGRIVNVPASCLLPLKLSQPLAMPTQISDRED